MDRFQYGDNTSSPFSFLWDLFSLGTSLSSSQLLDYEDQPCTETTRLLTNDNTKGSLSTDLQRGPHVPMLVQKHQQELRDELSKISNHTAYSYAKRQAPEYVESLELGFLCAEDWDATKAALRMLSFFDAKLSLFGSQALQRPLQVSDLDLQDREWLRSGSFQILPSRDKQSRRVLCVFLKKLITETIHNVLKAWWYFVMRIAEEGNEKLARSDFVGIIYNVDGVSPLELDRHVYWNAICSLKQLPMKISEWHYCHDDYMIHTVSPMIASYYSINDQATNLHLYKGSQTECTYNLLKAGLPGNELPLTETGAVDLDYHHRWLREHGIH